MGKNNPLTAKVNFIISVCFIGTSALLGIVTILEASDNSNPIADMFVARMVLEDGR